MKRQRGVTLGGVFFFMILIGFGVYAAARVLPGYTDYWTLQHIMKNIVDQPDVKDMKESAIRTKFITELRMNNMDINLNNDMEVEWVSTGVRLSLDYEIERPFMGPISLLMKFRAEETSK